MDKGFRTSLLLLAISAISCGGSPPADLSTLALNGSLVYEVGTDNIRIIDLDNGTERTMSVKADSRLHRYGCLYPQDGPLPNTVYLAGPVPQLIDLGGKVLSRDEPTGEDGPRWVFPSPDWQLEVVARDARPGPDHWIVSLYLRAPGDTSGSRVVESAALYYTPVVWLNESHFLYKRPDRQNYRYDVQHGEEVLIGHPQVFFSDVSPDGTQVAGSDFDAILLLDIRDLSLTTVFASPTTIYASVAWSPDGKHLVYARGRRFSLSERTDLYIYSLVDGTEFKVRERSLFVGGYWRSHNTG